MKRKIIKIDEDVCNGCGQCASGCPEGAIQILDGKARLVSELYCDGLGACIGDCPVGAITVEEREAVAYDERRTMTESIIPKGENVIKAHLKHLKDHQQEGYYIQAQDVLKEQGISLQADTPEPRVHHHGGGCPGSRPIDLSKSPQESVPGSVSQPSRLEQWPVQLHLLNPQAPYFQGAEICVAADCVAFAHGAFHERFLKGKKLVIFCPKLDQSGEAYIDKLAALFTHNHTPSVNVLHMEVPCCFSTVSIIQEAVKKSGQQVLIKEYTISINGEVI